MTSCYMVAICCDILLYGGSVLHTNSTASSHTHTKQSHCSLATHRSFSEGNSVSSYGNRSSLRNSVRGFVGKMLGEELAGNIVRLNTNVSACSLVLIGEESAPSELVSGENLKKWVPVCTGCCR